MIPPVFVAGCRFVSDASAGAAVRRFVAAYLDEMGMVARAPDVALVVTELSTNVVLHARTDFEVRMLRLEGGCGSRWETVRRRCRCPALCR